MQIYEFIANTFILAVSLFIVALSAFLLFITCDVILERYDLDERMRYALIAAILLVVIILIT